MRSYSKRIEQECASKAGLPSSRPASHNVTEITSNAPASAGTPRGFDPEAPHLVVGAHLHRADLGDAGALAAAALLAQDLDNPRFAHRRESTA